LGLIFGVSHGKETTNHKKNKKTKQKKTKKTRKTPKKTKKILFLLDLIVLSKGREKLSEKEHRKKKEFHGKMCFSMSRLCPVQSLLKRRVS